MLCVCVHDVCTATVLVYCEENIDEMWSLTWPQTLAGLAPELACPMETTGLARRECHMDGVWNEIVDITGCSREVFVDIAEQVEREMAYSIIIVCRNIIGTCTECQV